VVPDWSVFDDVENAGAASETDQYYYSLSGTKNRTVGRMGYFKFKTMYCIEPKKCRFLLDVEGSSEAYKIVFHQLEDEKPDNLDKKSVEHPKYE